MKELNIGEWRKKWEVDSILEPQLQIRIKQFHVNDLTLGEVEW